MIRVSLLHLSVLLVHVLCDASEMSQLMTDAENHDENVEECSRYKKNCSDLSNLCLQCNNYTPNCVYGNWSTVKCTPKAGVSCSGDTSFEKLARCIFCYQTEKWEHTCSFSQGQPPCSPQTKYYKANCTANPDVMCLGPRKFSMRLRCNVTRGHRWSTALILSITLGGFGADRFYLGHWQEGIGKLFSFGGLGVWTLVDVLLIAIRYLGPADGSLYV